MVSVAAGLALCLVAAVLNGTFASLAKVPKVRKASPHPLVFNFFVCLGVALSCLPACRHAVLNPLAFLSGALFVLSVASSFLAIERLGLAAAQGIWGGTALLTSFIWGVAGPKPVGAPPASVAGSAAAVVLLVVGILGVVFHPQVADRLCRGRQRALVESGEDRDQIEGPMGQRFNYGASEAESLVEQQHGAGNGIVVRSEPGQFTAGIAFALATGIFGGSVNVPSTMTQREGWGPALVGIETLPSFGLATLLVSCMVTTVYFTCDRNALINTGGFHTRAIAGPGLLSGCLWNAGNVCSIYANEGVSFAVSQPLLQCALLFSGVLGVFVFKEIQGRDRIATFFGFAGVILFGAALLSVFGKAAS